MFIEPKRGRGHAARMGWIEVICGSMFSGKTEELIRRLTRAKIARLKVQIFKPLVDDRYHAHDIVSHNQKTIASKAVSSSTEILQLAGDCDVVGIDEAQFFDHSLMAAVTQLANDGKRVIIAGLDMDSRGVPFGPMPQLMAAAEYVTKVHAICVQCGDIAHYSYRKAASDAQILIGETDSYEARCRTCYFTEEG